MTLLQDVRHSLRILAKNRSFTAIAIVTLALGIGANTAVFSVVNAVLLQPLAYPDAGRLVWLSDNGFWGDNGVSPAAYVLWKNAARSFESMIAYGDLDLALLTGAEATEERIAFITDNFWMVTGAHPALGRLFRPGERDTIVLSRALFERRFAGDPRVVGKTVTLSGHTFTITGVLPPGFQFIFPQQSIDERRDIDAYIPLPDPALRIWNVTQPQYEALIQSVGPTPWSVCVVGKLWRDVPLMQARAEMETIYGRVKRDHYPSWQQHDLRLHIAPLKDKIAGNASSALMVMSGAVGFVLLIASVNVAVLLLARASNRQREIAIRAALGAGRWRLIRQCLVESTTLAMLGGVAGLAVARWGVAIMVWLASEVIPRLAQARIDGRVLVFTLLVSLPTGLLFGLAPALSSWRDDLRGALTNPREFTAGVARFRLRGLLAGTELALAMVLLAGAGLMLKSFWRMNAHPPDSSPRKFWL